MCVCVCVCVLMILVCYYVFNRVPKLSHLMFCLLEETFEDFTAALSRTSTPRSLWTPMHLASLVAPKLWSHGALRRDSRVLRVVERS